MKIRYTRKFESLYGKLDLKIKKKTEKQENLFRQNTFHPSLNVEKLNPKHKNLWSFRIDRVYRVVFSFSNNEAVFLYIGHHKDIYRFDF